ncbi:hypothetical protein Tco_0452129 [Tanacetum coccineum]
MEICLQCRLDLNDALRIGFALAEFPKVSEIEGGTGRGLEAVDEERLKEVKEMKLHEGEDVRLQAAEEKMSEEVVAVEEKKGGGGGRREAIVTPPYLTYNSES